MYQLNQHPFPNNLYVKHRETFFCCFALLKTNIEKRYRVLMNIFRVVILGDHLRYHHWFLTTTIIVGMIVFFLLGMGLLKIVAERECERGREGFCGVER